jgi:hypothetical protein
MHVGDFGNCGAPCFSLGGADSAFVEGVMQLALSFRQYSSRIENGFRKK